MVTRDALKRLQDAQIVTPEQATAIESFFWQESQDGELAKTSPFVRFLLELGTSILLIGCLLGGFLWMNVLPAWQGGLIILIAAILLGCFGVILKRSSYHAASPLLLLGGSLCIPVILFRFYDALSPVFSQGGFWLPLVQQNANVMLGLLCVSFLMQYALFSCIKSRILSLPVALSWLAVIWMGALAMQSTFRDLTYILPAPHLAQTGIIIGAMVLVLWGYIYNTPDPGSTGLWPELCGLGMLGGILFINMFSSTFFASHTQIQLMYLGVAFLLGVMSIYIYARTQRVTWGIFGAVMLFSSILAGWLALLGNNSTGPLVLIGGGLALMILGVIWHMSHRRSIE